MTPPPHRIVCEFTYAGRRQADIMYQSLQLEAGEIPGDRARSVVSREGDAVQIEIEASDLVALRAGLNTWTGLVRVAEGILEIPASTETNHS